MSFSVPYVSATNASIWIADQWIDDACSIEYNEVSNKEAFYGYNDAYAKAFGQGRIIVVGALTINYRYTGYLTKAIMRAKMGSFTDNTTRIKDNVLQHVNAVRDGVVDPTSISDWLIQTAMEQGGEVPPPGIRRLHENYYDLISRTVKDSFWGAPQRTKDLYKVPVQEEELYNRIMGSPTKPEYAEQFGQVDVYVYMGTYSDEPNPERTEIIEDVQFTSNGKRIDNSSVEFGGMPIRERYEFIAKRVVPFREGTYSRGI